MNACFRTIWNEVRRAVVVVSELSGVQSNKRSGKKGGSEVFAHPRKWRLNAVAGAVTAVVMGLGATGTMAAPELVVNEIGGLQLTGGLDTVWSVENSKTSSQTDWSFNFSSATNDTYNLSASATHLWKSVATNTSQTLTGKDVTVKILGGYEEAGISAFETIANGAGANVIVNIQNLTIRGGSFSGNNAIGYAATNSGTVQIINPDGGQLSIEAGFGANNNGIGFNANGAGSWSSIVNEGGGTVAISGGSASWAYGIGTNASGSGSLGTISNKAEGSLTLKGGSGGGALEINAGSGGTGLILNEGEGILTINGGTGPWTHGIQVNASGTGSTGTVSNTASGDLTISGGGMQYNAYHSGIGTISNTGSGTLTILGGNEGGMPWPGGASTPAPAIEFNSSQGTGLITNTGAGSLTIEGGSFFAIRYNAHSSDGESKGTISNAGSGTLEIFAGSQTAGSSGTGAIQFNASGQGATGEIINSGTGTLSIAGSSTGVGIEVNADNFATGYVLNTGSGDLIIRGNQQNGFGIRYNATNNGVGTISNAGEGTLTIQGDTQGSANGLYYNGYGSGSTGTIIHEGPGSLSILGGKSSWGITHNASNGGSGTIRNEGPGTLTIQGGSGVYTFGVYVNAWNYGSTGSIVNAGSGELVIRGGSGIWASGFDTIAYMSGSTGSIINEGAGTLTIQGGVGTEANGIGNFARDSGSVGLLTNGEKGTLNIFGNASSNSFGIGPLTSSTGAKVRLENAGVMNLNKKAIQKFGQGDVLITNQSTGTVNTEAEAIFENGGTTSTVEEKPISVFSYSTGKTAQQTIDGFGTIFTQSSWKLKDDWANHSVWEDGGKLVITDIADGTAEAQSIRDAFTAKFGTGTTLEFTGTGGGSGSGSGVSSDFTIAHVNQLLSENKAEAGSVITSESLDAEGNAFKLGAGGQIEHDFGFMGIKNTSGISVADGKTLTLTGAQASMTLALRTNGNERASYVITEKETTLTNGQLKLGIAELSATQGILADVTADSSSAVVAEHGVFEISAVKGDGHVVVKEDSALTVGSLSAATTTNAGELTVNSDVVLKRPTTVNPFASNGKAPAKPVAFLNDKGAVANLQNITIEAGASIENKKDATLNAGTVTVGAGSLLWNYTGGKMNFDSLIVQGSIRDYGTLTVSDTLAVAKGGRYDYDGKVRIGNALMVDEGGELTMSGDSTLSRLVVGGDAVSAKILAASGGSDETLDAVLKVLDGEHYLETLELTSGTVNVAEGATLAGMTLEGNAVGSKITVEEGAVFAFSHDKNSLKSVMDNYKGGKLGWDEKTKLALSQALHFKDEGALSVGRTNAEGTVNLGSDALVLLGTTNLHGEAVFNGKGGDTLSVEEGAVLAVTDDFMWGNHYLAKGFDAASEEALKNLAIFDKEGKKLDVFTNEKGAHITIGSDDIADKDANYRLQNNINVVLDGMQDQESEIADVRVLTKLVLDGNGAAQSARLSSLTAEAGILSKNLRMAQDAFDTIIDHASTMRAKRGTVWAEGIYSKADVSGMKAENRRVGYESDVAGFAMGGDWSASGWHLGTAFSAQKGDLQATGSATVNVIDSYGVSLYGRKDFASGLTLTAGMTYSFGANEVVQQNVETLKADVDTNVLIAGGRVSYPIALNGFFVTPYARIEAVWSKSDAYTVTASGQDAFRFGKTNEVLGRIPLGMSASAFTPMLNGTLNVTADLSVAPQFGGKDYEQSVVGVTTGARDVTTADFADDWIGKLKLGVSYQGRQGSFDLFYEAARSDTLDAGHSFNAKAALYF